MGMKDFSPLGSFQSAFHHSRHGLARVIGGFLGLGSHGVVQEVIGLVLGLMLGIVIGQLGVGVGEARQRSVHLRHQPETAERQQR